MKKRGKAVRDGNCALCGEFKKLTFEHVPPAAAFNNSPIFVMNDKNLLDTGDKENCLYGQKSKIHQGFGKYSLCKTCNNNTGNWYAKDFVDFAHQGMNIIQGLIKDNIVPFQITGTYHHVKPLNILKQILTMFMSADSSGHLRSQKDLVDFILNREKVGLPNRYKVFIYHTLDSIKRMMGSSIVYDFNAGKPQKWSEISFRPFGYLLAEESDPPNKYMIDISEFGNINYDVEMKVTLPLKYLEVDGIWTGHYNNV